MYSLDAHGRMIGDGARTHAYFRALERCVTPDCVVADIGTGCGIFALFAAKLGARHVYAIDDAEVIETARDIAKHNDLHDRIEFIQKRSRDVSLHEPADVIVSDMRGVLPLFGSHLADIIDARTRLLRPGGTLIPQSDIICAAPVESDSFYHSVTHTWEHMEEGLDGAACRRAAVNDWYRHTVEPSQLLAPAAAWAVLDYATVDTTDVTGACEWTVSRNGRLHGLSFWFDAVLLGDIRYSNAPDEGATLYGAAFFPLETPVEVVAGDRVLAKVRAKKLRGDYLWTWETDVHDKARNHCKAHGSQSTFFGAMLSLDELHKAAVDARPVLNTAGLVTKTALDLMGSGKPAEDIAAALMNEFPDEFPKLETAARFTRRTVKEYAAKS